MRTRVPRMRQTDESAKMIRDPIEEAAEPLGTCDYCHRVGHLAIVRVDPNGNHSWACEECRSLTEGRGKVS